MRIVRLVVLAALAFVTLAAPARAGCPPDSVNVGNVCIDKYEESVWQIAPSNGALIKRVQKGKATLADLTGGGATQLSPANVVGCPGSPDYPPNFPANGNWAPVIGSSPPSPGVYAVSIPNALPSACITWFQANQACALSGKRLVRNGEWQRAAASTPDPGNAPGANDCNTNSGGPSNTGSRTNCKSAWGVFDMVGNMIEWVEDWADYSGPIQTSTDWTTSAGIAGGDESTFGGPGGSGVHALPAALVRDGSWVAGSLAGVFTVSSFNLPSVSYADLGFRCAR